MSGVVRRFAGLAGASLLGQALGFAALAYVARQIGAANLGAYAFASTLTSYVGLIANAGISYKAVRDVARDPECVQSAVREALVLQCSLAGFAYVVLLIFGHLLVPNRAAREMLPIVGLAPFLTGLTLDWALLAIGRARPVAVWRTIGQVAYAVPVPFLVSSGLGGALRYAGLNMVGLTVTAAGLLWSCWRVGAAGRGTVSAAALFGRLYRSVPFALVLVLLQVLGGLGPLLLGYLSSTRSVGLFAVAYKLPSALVTLTGVWLGTFLPHAVREVRRNRGAFVRDLERVLSLALVVLLVTAGASAVTAERLIPDLFGKGFAGAAIPFVLLTVSAGLVTVQACVTEATLVAIGSQQYYIKMLLWAVPLMLGVEVALILPFGATGAAGAAIVGDLYLAIAGSIGVTRKVGQLRLEMDIVSRGAASAVVMTGVTAMVQARIGLLGGLVAGGAALIAAGFATGLVRRLR